MNRQYLGITALVITLATVQMAAGQFAGGGQPMMPYSPAAGGQYGRPQMAPPAVQAQMMQAQLIQAQMMQAQMMQGAGPGMQPPGMMPGGPMGPGMMPGGPMGQPGMMPGGPMGPGMMPGGPMGQPGMMPGGPMGPGMMPGGPMGQPGMMPGQPVRPAIYSGNAPGAAQPASCSGCEGGCDSCCASSCGDGCGGLLGQLGCWSSNLFGKDPCGNGGGLGCLSGNCGLGRDYHKHGPYGTGGCCLPRWFDVQAEWLYWNYDFDESLALSSDGILGPTALDTNQLDMNYESGYRVTGAYLVGPGTAVEASYFGGHSWADSSSATSDGNLFSVFSDFGSDPLNGFPETGFGNLHRVSVSTEMNNGELNLRRRFVSANCVAHSSILVGVRYFRFREDMVYETFTNTDSMSYQLKASNDLIGVQTGGDFYLCMTPRFKIGADIKAGVYGTHSTARTSVFCPSCEPLRELESASDAAFLGEAGAIALYRVTPRLTLRTAYQVLYVDGIATAVDNFNTESPFSARNAFINSSGNAFIHGANCGFEWTW